MQHDDEHGSVKSDNSAWTIWGISELSCWLGHRNPTSESPSGRDAEDCLEAHRACGIDHVIWDIGRSVLYYHSDLPTATCRGLRDEPRELTVRARQLEAIYRERCQLRAALRCARSNTMTLYGRLCMNRHYKPDTPQHRSEFAQAHPQWCEVRKDGWLDPTRLCYGIPEYRQERVAILMEAVNIGVDGLCLDFCRQPPIVRYHPVFVNDFRERTGTDPRQLTLDDRETYLEWCAYRAESVTACLRDLHEQLQGFRKRFRRPVPIQVRIPNDGLEANMIAGLDIMTWCREGLIDELALSELHWIQEYQTWDDSAYVDLGSTYGIPVYASSNCLPRQDGGWGGEVNPRGISPLVLGERALRSHEIGAQGIALYQSDTGVQWPSVRHVVGAMSDPEALSAYVQKVKFAHTCPVTDENADFGIDNHSVAFPHQTHAGPGVLSSAV